MPKKDIQQSVTNAILDQKLITLTDTVKALTETVDKGFQGVHTRQDVTNGKVLKNITDITELKSKANYDKVIWLLVTTLVGIVVYFVTKAS